MNVWEYKYPRIELLDDFSWEVFASEIQSWLYFRFEDDVWDQISSGMFEDSKWQDFQEIWDERPANLIQDASSIEKDYLFLKFTESGTIPAEAWKIISLAIDLNLSGWNDQEYAATLENIEELKENFKAANLDAGETST